MTLNLAHMIQHLFSKLNLALVLTFEKEVPGRASSKSPPKRVSGRTPKAVYVCVKKTM
jgi:hypothetical protein